MRKNTHSLWFSPLLTAALLLLVYGAFGFFPLGGKSITWCDMSQQVIPLLGTFKGVLTQGNSMFFDMGAAAGINFWGVFFFFLSSPFSFLAAFVPLADMPLFMNVLLILKVMVCAFTASLFFLKFFPELKALPITLLGLLYAFCGYMTNYYQNIVWIDMMALFPLLLLALISMMTRQKVLPFILAFSGMLIVNYYLSYMVVLFLIFGVGLFQFFCSSGKRMGENVLLLGAGAVISVLLTAPVWLPSLLEVMNSARGEGLVESLSKGNLLTGIYTSIPVLLGTALPFASLFFLRKKLMRTGFFASLGCCLLLFLLPIFLDPINKMWHTGSYQSFPVRYGYMVVFLLLILAGEIFTRMEPSENDPPVRSALWAKIALPLLGILYAFLCVYLLANDLSHLSAYTSTLHGDKTSFTHLLAFFLCTVMAYAAVLLVFRSKKASRGLSICILTVLILSEGFFNGGVYLGSNNRSIATYKSAVDLSEKINDDGFYRVKTQGKYFDVNLFSAMGYQSLSHYTSLTPETYLTGIRRLGYSGYWMEVNSNGGTAFSDALLGNRYIVRRRADVENSSLLAPKTVYWNNTFVLEKLPFSLPSAVVTNAQPGFLAVLPEGESRPYLQQELADELFPGAPRMFVDYKEDKGSTYAERTYTIPVTEKQILYFDCSAMPSTRLTEGVNKSCRILVNGELIHGAFPTQSENGLLELGTFQDETVTVTVEISKAIKPASFGVFGLKLGALQTLSETAEGSEMLMQNGRITVDCQADAGQTLFLPVSYDKGLKARVNGVSAPISLTAGCFLSLPLQQGANHVEITYTPPGLKLGLILFGAGVLLALWFFARGRSFLLKCERFKTVLRVLFTGTFFALLIVVYLAPMFIYAFRH